MLDRAGHWFLRSGIQEANGGVARYYRSAAQQNNAVSTEITGYAVSTLVHLFHATGNSEYLDRAIATGRFLARDAWNAPLDIIPFEYPHADFAYFFDCGIVVRSLLTLHRAAPNDEFTDGALRIGRAMARDFRAGTGEFHPILTLPGKAPVSRDDRWSRSVACYQLKSALAWRELFELTADPAFDALYREVLDMSFATWRGFLPGHPVREKVMDRLHAFSYFLEAILPLAAEPCIREALAGGIERVAFHLRDIGPLFERSDVYAQLLRARIYADWLGAVPLDLASAQWEAQRLRTFQAVSEDPRIDGGFWFGRKGDQVLPFVNPVSTGFALQALDLWHRHQSGAAPVPRQALI